MYIKTGRKILLVLTICFTTLSSIAQDYIDEDFIEKLELNAKPMWAENIAAFSKVPNLDKYADQSAVVLGYKRHVTFDKKSRTGFLGRGDHSLTFYENVRFKIKLNDRNAIQSFTEIYFRYRVNTDGFSAHIIKPDGTETTVALDQAIKLESSANIPEFFQSFFDRENENQSRYYKVAVPGLEPGDILEYVTVTTSKLEVGSTGCIEFSPQYEFCSKNYPILFNQIAIEMDDKSYFKSMSFNGSPGFVKEAASADGFYRYVFTDTDRDVDKDVNFVNIYQVYPMTKFQVIYARNEDVKGVLIGKKGEMKSGFTKEELAKKAWEDYVDIFKTSFQGMSMKQVIAETYARIKKKNIKNLSNSEFADKAYYWIRNMVLFRDTYISDKSAAYLFGSLLAEHGIKSDLIIAASTNTGKISNILFDTEIRYAVKVGDSIYFNLTDHSNPKELVSDLLGADAYVLGKPGKDGQPSIAPLVLPNASSNDNTAVYTITTSLDSTLTALNVLRTSDYTGISKSRVIYDAHRYTNYMLDDYRNFDGLSPSMAYRWLPFDFSRSMRAMEETFEERKGEMVKKGLQSEYGTAVTYKKFMIVKSGRWLEEKDLVFEEDFQLNGMIRKAGKKLLVNVPGLVGSQLQIKKDERTRTHDIHVSYARNLTWVINFKIPEGYKVDGLKELATTVDNEAGRFVSNAEQKGDTVVMTITKTYKKANVEKDKWQDMLAFVDAAYNNSFKYLLLTPKN